MASEVGDNAQLGCICGPSHAELMCPVHGAAAREKRSRDQWIDRVLEADDAPAVDDAPLSSEKSVVVVVLCILGGVALLTWLGAIGILAYSFLKYFGAI